MASKIYPYVLFLSSKNFQLFFNAYVSTEEKTKQKKNRFHCKHKKKKIVPNIIIENIENKSRDWLTCHQTRASSIPYFFYFIRHSNNQLIQIEHFLNGYLLLLCMHFVLCICISRLFLCFFFSLLVQLANTQN